MTGKGKACIAVDAMGSDLGPAEMVAAARLALESDPELDPIVLVGDQAILNPLIKAEGLENHAKLSVRHASQVVEMSDKPLQALRQKKDASMIRAIELVKDGEAQVVISCGNTGTLMAGGTIKLRTMSGVERPALATVMPHKTGHYVLLDAGANPQASAENMVHNAVLGSVYAKTVLGIENPRVGLLTIGTEEGKGTDLINASHHYLREIDHVINYTGLIEGFQLFENVVDVVVCDGFTGNIVLKTCESLFNLLKVFAAEELNKNPVRQFGYLLSKGAFDAIKTQLKPERYGGAPLLGLKGNILKAHGSSNREAVMNAIRIGHEIIRKDLNSQITSDIDLANIAISEIN
ncbi:phosphate acyltransferase PlsX [Puniceicoccaceae bacterium K14]|nr:phosphate acyltransferase PlsX [Puniceicoccaceae bacterium K14]